MLGAIGICLLLASSAFAAEPPTDFVARLCTPGKKCCFVASASVTVAQSSSVSEPQPQTFATQFCVTSNTPDDGKYKAVFSKATESREVGDFIDPDRTSGLDLVAELTADVDRRDLNNVKEAPVYYTLDTDGSIKEFACSLDTNQGAECEIQMAVLKAALRKVKINAPQATSLLSAPTGTTTHHGVHAELGKYKLEHSQEIKDGKVHLLSTTTFEGSKLKHQLNDEPTELLGQSGATEKESSITAAYVVQDKAVLKPNGQVESFSATDKTELSSSVRDLNPTTVEAAAAFLQTSGALSEDPEDAGSQPSAGKTKLEMTFNIDKTSEEESSETFEVTTAFIQVPHRIHFGPGKTDGQIDMDYKEVLALFHSRGSLMSIALTLEQAPSATVALDAKVWSWYQANEINDGQYGRYLAMLASVNTAAAEALFITKLTDGKLQRDNAPALEQAMLSLLSRTKGVPEGMYRTLLEVAETSEVANVRDTALLVLSGLLDNHSHLEGSKTMPAWCQQMFDKVMSTVDNGKFRSEVNAAALGNTRWSATQPKLAEYLSHPDLFTVHVAVDGLRHHANKLSDETEEKLYGVLTGHNWNNISSQIPIKVVGLLQHSAKVKGGKAWKKDVSYPTTLNIFSYSKPIPKDSDYHKSNVNVASSLSYDTDTKDISFTTGAALEATLFGFKFSYDGGNAITDITFEAKRSSKTKKWDKGIVLSVLGKAVKVWGSVETDSQETTWKKQIKSSLLSYFKKEDVEDVNGKEHGICKGRFDFTKAAASIEEGVTLDTSGTVALSVSWTQTFAQGKWSFYLGFGFSAEVSFAVDGTVGVVPAVGWGNGNNVGKAEIEAQRLGGNLDDCAPGGTTWVAGLKPFGKLELTLSVLIEFLFFTKAGVQAKITLIEIGFPTYGRLIPSGSGYTSCGSLELEANAFSGVIKAVFYIRESKWYCIGLPCGDYPSSPTKEWSIFTWDGIQYVSQIGKVGAAQCDWNYGSGWVPTRAPTHVHHSHHSHHRHHSHHSHFWGRRRLLDAGKAKEQSKEAI